MNLKVSLGYKNLFEFDFIKYYENIDMSTA